MESLENQTQVFHSSHRPWKSLRDSHIPTASTTAYIGEAKINDLGWAKLNRGSKLFTFLDHNEVPWNNNNAEHAIKAFVRLRRGLGGKSSAKSIRDYLVLLSISETGK